MNNILKKLFKVQIHPCFCINGRALSIVDLDELGYSYIKEGADFEKEIGQFILDWIDSSPIIIVQTSGSTGVPKSIELKKEYMVNSALATGSHFKLFAKKSALLCLPANYIAGKMMLVRAMTLGLDLYIVPPTSNPISTINKVFDFGAMVPLQVMKSLPKLHLLKTLLVGGAPISNLLRGQLCTIENNSFETYGMTETITHIAVKPLNQLLSSVVAMDLGFKILPGVEISKDDRDCLIIKAPRVSDETVITNDIVELVSENEFRWLGRYDNVINSGGVKLYPEQIEHKLSGYLSISFFVIGVNDDVLGQKVVLIVEGLIKVKHIEKILESIEEFNTYEKPKEVLVTNKFIRTASGKIQRNKTLQKILNV